MSFHKLLLFQETNRLTDWIWNYNTDYIYDSVLEIFIRRTNLTLTYIEGIWYLTLFVDSELAITNAEMYDINRQFRGFYGWICIRVPRGYTGKGFKMICRSCNVFVMNVGLR